MELRLSSIKQHLIWLNLEQFTLIVKCLFCSCMQNDTYDTMNSNKHFFNFSTKLRKKKQRSMHVKVITNRKSIRSGRLGDMKLCIFAELHVLNECKCQFHPDTFSFLGKNVWLNKIKLEKKNSFKNMQWNVKCVSEKCYSMSLLFIHFHKQLSDLHMCPYFESGHFMYSKNSQNSIFIISNV